MFLFGPAVSSQPGVEVPHLSFSVSFIPLSLFVVASVRLDWPTCASGQEQSLQPAAGPSLGSGAAVATKMAETNQTARPFYTCTEVNELCPVEATTLGYYPIKGLSIFFAVCFGLAGVITVVLGTWKKTWSYMTFVAAGCFLELAGEFSVRHHTTSTRTAFAQTTANHLGRVCQAY